MAKDNPEEFEDMGVDMPEEEEDYEVQSRPEEMKKRWAATTPAHAAAGRSTRNAA